MTSQCSSRESAGAKSEAELLTVGRRLTGVPHGQLASAQARWETQMSRRPWVPRAPGRFEAKYRLSPSLERTACWSLKPGVLMAGPRDRKSTRLNSSHTVISYAVFCLKKKKKQNTTT